MLCELCKKNDANIHITKIINGLKYEFNVCEKCAKEKGDLSFSGPVEFSSPFTFQNILSGIMDYIGTTNHLEKNLDISCSDCGNTYGDFKKTGLVGCSECYKSFTSTLMPVIKRVQGNIEHTGKIPQRAGKNMIERKRLLELKEDLQKAIAAEKYEKAAEIRDIIKGIQKEQE